MRWASSRMVVSDLPARLRAKACSMSLRSQAKAELSNSMRKASDTKKETGVERSGTK